jgi:hypothetical protein
MAAAAMAWDALAALRAEIDRVPLDSAHQSGSGLPIVSAPMRLSPGLWRDLEQIGRDLGAFLRRCWRIRQQRDVAAAFLGTLTSDERAGYERLAVLEQHFPVLARPDLVPDEDGRLWIAEVDLHPGQGGVLQRLQELFGQAPSLADIWAERIAEPMILSMPGWKRNWPEQRLLAERINERGGRLRLLPVESWDAIGGYSGHLFLNCCTISLLNARYPPVIPARATLSPPPILDWKGWLALAHSSANLGDLALRRHIPESYLLPLAPGRETSARRRLLDLTVRERDGWIMKPSNAWGGQGFREARDVPLPQWNAEVLGIAEAATPGVMLQRRVESGRFDLWGLNGAGRRARHEALRAKICPFYVFRSSSVFLAGALVVLRPSIKVHGAADAVVTLAIREDHDIAGAPLNAPSRPARASRRRR